MKHCGSELKVHWDSSKHVCFPSLPSLSAVTEPATLPALILACCLLATLTVGEVQNLSKPVLLCAKETLLRNTSWRGRFLEGHLLSQVAYSQSTFAHPWSTCLRPDYSKSSSVGSIYTNSPPFFLPLNSSTE